MQKLRIFISRFASGSFKRMFRNARMISKETKVPTPFILLDMAFCIIFRGVGYLDYRIFGYAGKSSKVRNTYMNYIHNVKLTALVNDKNYKYLLDSKIEFNNKYKDLIGRKYINPKEVSFDEFLKFCLENNDLFIKPNDSFVGIGIYKKIKIEKDTNIKELYDYLCDNGLFVEERIVQNEIMESLHPGSINTVRIATLVIDNKPNYIYSILRMGVGGMVIDNSTSGGLNTRLSDKGEILKACFCDKTAEYHTVHPTSGKKLVGFKVPMFKEAVELCLKAAMVTPELGYIGWDVAITNKGPVIVEANDLPGYDMPQNFGTATSQTGLLPLFEEIIGQKI